MAKERDLNDAGVIAAKTGNIIPFKDTPIPSPGEDFELGDYSALQLDKMNLKYSFIKEYGGAPAVMCRIYNAVHDKQIIGFISLQSLKERYTNEIAPGSKDKLVKLGNWWIDHEKRKEFATVIFNPNMPSGECIVDDNLKVYNLWEGFAVEPKKGSWKKTRTHIYRILCNGEKAKFVYTMKWLAWCIQNPGTRAEVAIAFKGLKGAGKGFIFTQMCQIFGRHGLSISNPDHLTGKHNAHLMYVSFLFADEAYYPGAKATEGLMKQLITEPCLTVEPKFKLTTLERNCLHIGMSTNADWVVPASNDERRFFINLVSPKYAKGQASDAQRGTYFKALWDEMELGGRSHLLYDLLNMKLGDWHPRDSIPYTQELENQKVMSTVGSDNAPRIIVAMLERGHFPGKKDMEGRYIVTSAELEEYLEIVSPRSKKIAMRLKAQVLKRLGATPLRTFEKRYWQFPELGAMKRLFDKEYVKYPWEDYDNWEVTKVPF